MFKNNYQKVEYNLVLSTFWIVPFQNGFINICKQRLCPTWGKMWGFYLFFNNSINTYIHTYIHSLDVPDIYIYSLTQLDFPIRNI